MKKTLTINLNGSVFHIDEDAYQTLNNYLNEVDKHFPKEEDKEILRDIEARIGELFTEKLNANKAVIELADVQQIISVLGQPNQFGDEQTEKNADEPQTEEKNDKKRSQKSRKLYRDTDNQMIGGVLAGIAAYLGVDVVWLRILTVLLLFFGFGTPIIIYLLAMIIIPDAKTSAQKLEMRGEEVTADSIKNFFESEQFRENANKVGSKFGEIVLAFAKIFVVFFGVIFMICGILIIVGIAIGTMAMLIEKGTYPFFNSGSPLETAFGISLFLLCLIPAIGMIVGSIRMIRRDFSQKRQGYSGWILLIVWVASLLIVSGTAIYLDKNDNFHWNRNCNFGWNIKTEWISENRSVSGFNRIDAKNALEIEIVEEDTTYLEVENSRHIITEVKDSVLYIKYSPSRRKPFNFDNLGGKIIIHTPKIKKIEANNACEIYSNLPLKTENFELKVNNACEVDLDVVAKNNVIVECENATDLDMKITANYVKVKSGNACDLDVKIKAKELQIEIGNATDADFDVDVETLNIDAASACDINVKGQTETVNSNSAAATDINLNELLIVK
ncbi:MAG: DUF2807 domain-containing protein [Prevotellaceae bacterium]|jgi:phage shock protein PspC (stress-responsive transcriptional regulator)|nr:DUF2807 domain-containing protein [Prevotellaceae bacterium]